MHTLYTHHPQLLEKQHRAKHRMWRAFQYLLKTYIPGLFLACISVTLANKAPLFKGPAAPATSIMIH